MLDVRLRFVTPLLLTAWALVFSVPNEAFSADLKLLFMGDNGHHRPESRFQELADGLEGRGIVLKYTDRMTDLNPETLAGFDGLILYANIDWIEDPQAQAVLDYVSNGSGFIPLHCATYCWRNNAEIVALMGAQFQRHGQQVFSTQIAAPNHPIMKKFSGFESWDETYIHHRHNEKNRTVLEYRVDGVQAEGKEKEPWTWTRTHGKGRVFYTAWGHDHRTFTHSGFHNLVERGIRWACRDDPAKVPPFPRRSSFKPPGMTTRRTDVAPFQYVDVGPKIPNYQQGKAWGKQGEPQKKMQLPLSPEESIKHFVTPKGLAVRLYADERNFEAKPIAMTWDERGRLWICETLDYPNELGGYRDRIRICEDTDHDHVADKFTVFADGLSIPTAIVIVRGGAIVQNGTETIYLKDTDGDGVSDEKTTLISNWNLGDTHGGVSNFRYGLDNWIWAMQGYNNSSPVVDGKKQQSFRMGFWRFKLSQTDPPKVTELEFVRSSNNNTWGLGFSEEGLVFGSTANHNPSMFMPIPNRYYERVRGWAPRQLDSIADTHKFQPITENVRQVDHFGGYTAAAGHALYTARAFPQQWWNRTAFVCGPTGHLVGTFVLNSDGADYRSTSPVNLLASDDEWSAPIIAEVGPDGAVWVVDWYNYIVQHNPTPRGFETGKGRAYKSDLRDKKHGRIYRVVPVENAGHQLHSFGDLASKTNEELAETLTHPSMRWRLQAQRLLVERNALTAIPGLSALVNDDGVDAIGLNVGAIHALHTLSALRYFKQNDDHRNVVDARSCLAKALNHPSAGVRLNAVAVLPRSKLGLELLLGHSKLFNDDSAQVRLHSIMALADMPASNAAGSLIRTLCNATNDGVTSDALTSAAAVHGLPFLQSLVGQQASNPNLKTLQVSTRVAEHIARGRPDAEELQKVIQVLTKCHAGVAEAILAGLTAGLPRQVAFKPTPLLDETLLNVFENVPVVTKSKVLQLATLFHSTALDEKAGEILKGLSEVVADSEMQENDRLLAARNLVALKPGDNAVIAAIVEQLGPRTTPEFGEGLLKALQGSRSETAATQLAESISSLTPKLKTSAIATLMSRPVWAKTLLSKIESNEIPVSDLALDQQQALRTFPDKEIRQRAGKILVQGGGLPDEDREKVFRSLVHVTRQNGDVDAGRTMFKKHCASCHQHGELGKAIGPNLTGMAVHSKAELLTHIIDPSRNVEGNFRTYTAILADGRVLNGMLSAETRTSVAMIDTQAKQINIQRDEIEQLIASRKSVMPEGFEKQMSEQELTDLLEFLTDKGQYLPVPLDKFATAISTKALFHNNPDNGPDRLVFPNWKPKVFKTVPFLLTDPKGRTKPNIIMLHGPQGTLPPKMPKSVELPCHSPAKEIHFLSGVGGWSFPAVPSKSVSMVVRLVYADGKVEEHELRNGVHFADYIRRVDVPGSEFAFALGGQQIRYLNISPKRKETIRSIQLQKGNDLTAPIVMAVTIERVDEKKQAR